MRRWSWFACSTLAVSSIVTLVAAADIEPYPTCTTKPTPSETRAAQGAFEAGSGSYEEADYPKAIMYWRDAYRRDCTAHMLLLNLANAYEKMGDKPGAIHALRTYIERVPDDKTRSSLERRIQNLEMQVSTGTETKQDAAAPAPTATETAPPPTATSAPTSDQPPPAKQSIAPWIVVGSGAALAIVGGLVYLGGSKKVGDSEDVCGGGRACPNTDEGRQAAEDGDSGRTQMVAGGVVGGIGVVAVAGGLVWHFAFDKPTSTTQATRPSLNPAFSTGYAGVQLGGKF